MLVILLTSLIGYFVNKKLTGYGYRHREEEGGDFQKALVPNPATPKLYRRKRYPDFRDEAVDAGKSPIRQ